MAIKIIESARLKWINIDHVDETAVTYLRQNFSFHHLDLEDVQGESHIPKVDVYKNYLFVILQFPQWQAHDRTVVHHEVDIFLGEGYLVTIQNEKSKEMKNFFYRCMKNRSVKQDWMEQSSGYLLYRIIEALFRHSQPILNNIGKKIILLEQEIFGSEPDTGIIYELARHRRNVVNFRRVIDPQRYLVSTITHIHKPFLNEETSLYFDDLNDYLNKIWTIVDTYKDTLNGLHTTVESLINRRINKTVSTLTVISVSLLPFSVLSSIYGMNIRGLPFVENPIWVWAMFAVLSGIIAVIIYRLKRKRWL